MAKKQPEGSHLPDSSDSSQNASSTDETTENSELTNSATDESNLRANNGGSLLESKMNSKDTFTMPAIQLDSLAVKLDAAQANQAGVTLKTQKDSVPSGHTFLVEDLNLSSEAGSGKQASKASSGKQQSLRLGSRQQRILKNLKRNLKRNAKATSNTPASPLKRNSLSQLVDMMIQFNLVPKSGQPASAVKSSALVNSGAGNEQSTSTRATRIREFAIKSSSPGRSKQTAFTSQSQSLPTRPMAAYDAGAMPVYQESPINSFYSIYPMNPMVNRAELLDARILYLFEQIVNLLDRFLVLITDFREEVAQLENRDIALDRMIFQENNSVLLDAITNTLPDRLGERFGRELEKALKKFLGDKANKKQK